MEPGSGKNKEHREITYQVGWKKGKIEWNEGAGEAFAPKAHRAEPTWEAAARRRLQLIWLPAMKLPGWLLLPLLYALPVLCFTLTLVLIIGLRHG
ncbi:hypothetical protein ACFPES_00645 [Paenibacillus sp. GCM10023248]|uniref:hypothetical protein n=1 Tax=Bacillales TaxID=1385 RepID=UPI002379F938|nr:MULTISPECIES: hypothetical protein [Bacillales]MDD9265529.1 hypothetical protein [Paenibacillus sp. MAHUQ-63]MDR6885439.1 hypothetical protein [Bacillus sp. 3255]